ncbi:DUF3922 domain-containing protein [Chitinophaga sedimenti]|uniref:DUF3922 domain-containing protein n=1 Tax=Chitinophaga sedimenti TaxID=2033606 RepID=UPI002004FE27|nr:DUF3922 domain-containing protein [Chitinophaga sedimenti]MCK7555670.1 DUF3922 domain-containing protein [Chitinophaga sedimenti]
MNTSLLKDLIDLAAEFELLGANRAYTNDISGFRRWMSDGGAEEKKEPYWEGKEKGRSPESVINTLIVHMNRYARTYSKAAIHDSEFSTQEEFIYLINLRAFGDMTKMELIKKNVQINPRAYRLLTASYNRAGRSRSIQQPTSVARLSA